MRIRHQVADVDEQHQRAITTIEDDVARANQDTENEAVTAARRGFVRKLGLTGVVAIGAATVPISALTGVAAAQDAPADPDADTTDTTAEAGDALTGDAGPLVATGPDDVASEDAAAAEASAEAGGISDDDLKILVIAQGLELALVTAYGLAVDTRLLDSPEAELCHAFARHHKEHALALATVAGKENLVTEASPELINALTPTINAATDSKALLASLQKMEESVAATYLEVMGTIDAWWVAGATAKILPIEAQHAAVLGQAIGLAEDKWLPAVQQTAGAFEQIKAVG